MITLNASGGSITFEFSGNSTYLNDGTITVPVNSLALIIDESDMATFKKAASNDIFVSANIAEFGMTKDELESWFKENAVGSTGGGGGITSGEVQTMIDESVSGKTNESDFSAHTANTIIHVTSSQTAAWDAKSDFSGSYNDLTDKPTIPTVPTSNTAFTNDAQYATSGYVNSSVSGYADAVAYDSNAKAVKFYHGGAGGTEVYNFDASPFLIDGMVQNVEIKSVEISGVATTCLVISFNTDAGKQDINIPISQIFDASNYYTTAQTNSAISAAVSGKADTSYVDSAVSGKVDTNTYTAYTAATDTALSNKLETSAVTSAVTSGSTDVLTSGGAYEQLGGLSLVKLTESEYTALVTKDPNVLYVVIPDPSNP